VISITTVTEPAPIDKTPLGPQRPSTTFTKRRAAAYGNIQRRSGTVLEISIKDVLIITRAATVTLKNASDNTLSTVKETITISVIRLLKLLC